MKKILHFLLVFMFFSIGINAQNDTEHWFAPMRDRASSTSSQQTLFLSTEQTTPFPVTIYNNGNVIGTVTISKGNPGTFVVTRDMMIATTDAQCNVPSTRGVYAIGPEKFFASMRIYYSAHGEFIASKGKAGLGTEFRAVVTPNNSVTTLANFVTGVIATEDNTTVTVDQYSPAVQFSNGTNGTNTPVITFTLNRGQSYIIEGSGNIAGNAAAFCGARIVSDKPIAMINGNMNGNYAFGTFGGSDIIMDQSVPIERLGKTFVIIKGNANIGTQMEGALITAVEDQTDIFVNGSPTAIATINAGQTYRILDNNYINQAGTTHYNMYISTTKNVYVYQLVGGKSTDNATEGFNYIPPLSCYLPRRIDEIGMIQMMAPNLTPSALDLKLNILTEAGATVTINNNPPPAGSGPFPVTGNTNWVTYSVPNPTGNITVVSDKALTAGVTGGYSTAGYGGYFAGFSSVPAIMKSDGDCIPGIRLSVEEIYETYQWFLNGTPISGANTFEYYPTVPGVYTITVSISGCQPVTTPPMNVFPCKQITNLSSDVCGSKNFDIVFTNSTETLDLSSVNITTPPANGTVTVNVATSQITYVPNPGYLGPDTFTYEFNSTVPTFFDSEEVTVDVNVVLLQTYNDDLTACPYNGVAIYDLTTTDVTAFANASYKYYPTLTDAQNQTNQIINPNAYASASGSVYVRVTTPEGCFDFAKIDLFFYDQPTFKDDTLDACFIESSPSTGEFDLTLADIGALAGTPILYYPSLPDAENNTNLIANPFTYISTSSAAYARVHNANGCFSIAKINLNVISPTYSIVLKDKTICLEGRTTLDAGDGFDAYLWSTGATTQSISGVGVGEYWVKLTSNGCVTQQKVYVKKAPEIVISNVEITNNTATITVLGGAAPYEYSLDGISWQASNVFNDLSRGENVFYVRDSYSCSPISVGITIPNLVNVITPNDDGINDVVDYSALRYKDNLEMAIYDRYGNKVHMADKTNNYIWDGRFGGKRVSTGTYWYHITWNESDAAQTQVKYSGWIMVKNN